MINGSPSNEFKMERDLRQGDPLSPFLFLIVAEALQVCILDACNKGLYNGVSLAGCGANVSLLQYAGYASFFGNDLKVNISKSRILGVGVSEAEIEAVASSIGCAHGTFPFSYLGLPVGKKMRLKEGWNAIIDRFRDKLSSWKAKNLSTGGRLHLNADEANKWVWSLDSSGSFKVSTLTKRIQNIRLAEFITGDHHLWNSLVPRKVNIYVWRASLNRLPTRVNLDLRGINMASNLCPFCDTCVEDIEHCLINCSHSLAVWRKIWSWWNMPSPLSFPIFSIKDIALGNIGLNGSSHISKVVHGVFLTAVWSIWNWRNRIVNAQPDAVVMIKGEDIFLSIQRLSMTWIAARLASLPANWNSWVAKPFELFS
ncbi:putative RNA-directed DNA polymerase, eukaryota, reverse transcriptase zinc-binding domain protein [Tanacetum coccineum]